MEKKNGKLIVVEGACDGIGKSTQVDKLRKRLLDSGEMVESYHFPSYNTSHGENVERYLRGEFGNPKDLDPYFVHSLYADDREYTWKNVLQSSFDNGHLVLLDRYTTSSLIYQSAVIDDIKEKEKFIKDVIKNEYIVRGIRQPDNVIFLYAPFDLVTSMRLKRKFNDGIVGDIYEKDLHFMKKVYDSAMFVAEYMSWDMIECNEGDTMRPIDDINEEIYQLVKRR